MTGKAEERRADCTMILLAAGNGSRMKSKVAKQYMPLGGKPVLWYSLMTAEQSAVIDRCILVVGADDLAAVREEIVDRYAFRKVEKIIAGGAQRYDSVYQALLALPERADTDRPELIFVHDGARPFITEEILQRTYDDALRYGACVAGMPVKDTMRIADVSGFAESTPDRRRVWEIQTPQVFERRLIAEAYRKLMENQEELAAQGITVTDDAMVVEAFAQVPIRLTEGSYENKKITTPEDIPAAEAILAMKNRK